MNFSTNSLELNEIRTKISSYSKTYSTEKFIESLLPSTNFEIVETLLNETNDMLNLIVKHGKLPLVDNFDENIIKDFKDIKRILSIDELLGVKSFLMMEKEFLGFKKQLKETNNVIINNYLNNLFFHSKLIEEFNIVFNNYGEINDNASQNLLLIRKNMFNLSKKLDDKMQQLLQSNSNYLSEKMIVTKNNRLCLAVKESYKNRIKGVVHDISASGQTYFIEPEASLKITAEIEINKINENKEITKILANLTNYVVDSILSLQANLTIFVNLDILMAKANYALDTNSIKPNINKEGIISLVKAYHPLLNRKEAVPISLNLNNKDNTLLITGPNTGGKTVALKTVGLLSMMVQSGILVPVAHESNFNVFNNIFADIGDEQSIENSLSTFSSHMTKIAKMLENLTDNSLILLDELGSGTDPNEGVAIAIAITEAFREFDVRLIITSHYLELKNYAYETEGIITASVAFDKNSLKPLYYLQHGITGQSHALLIAKRLNLSDKVINRAKKLHESRESDLAKIMSKLNDERIQIEAMKDELNVLKHDYLAKKANYQLKYEEIINEREEVLQKITEKEQAKWEKATNEIKVLLKDLESNQNLKNPEIANIKGRISNAPKTLKIETDEVLKIGDQVLIKSYNQYGEIVNIKKDNYQVVFGLFDLEFKKEDLKLVESKKQVKTLKKVPKKQKSSDVVTKKGDLTLDLRGYRYEEVKAALENAIDDALLSNIHSLTIIHGFGTGAVRKAVYEFIKNSKYIKSHRFGKEGEGLNGVTIIELK